MKDRNLYLTNLPIDEAFNSFLECFDITAEAEIVNTASSLDRITANAIFAKNNSPLYDSAAMDGIAVISEKTIGASETSPLKLTHGQDYIDVDTGDPIIPPFDAVIMAEDVQDECIIHQAAAAWQHVRPIGEDIVKGEMILPSKHKLRPVDIGALLSGGIFEVDVIKRPRLAVIPTGSELVEAYAELPEDSIHEIKPMIIESNSYMLSALADQGGAISTRSCIIEDDYNAIKNAVKNAASNYDIVLICSGTSAGKEDYTRNALDELGHVVVHGVAMKPGKPVILAVVDGKPVIGIPGYPVSAYVAYENFVRPIIKEFLKTKQSTEINKVKARLTRRLPSSLKHTEFVRMKVGKVDENLVATPLSRGAGSSMSLVRADGFCVIPSNFEGLESGVESEIVLLRELKDLESAIISIGSHDLVLDILSDFLIESSGIRLSSSHVGSMGGLLAMQKEEAHIAPIHLLDEATGIYNVPIINKLFPNKKMALIKCVGRVQGIITSKGNPLGIKDMQDLLHYRYINRQRGAGTRTFFDHHLKPLGISPSQIIGYDREAATHMAVAAAVKSGSADAGMGVMSVAKAMDLHFVPIDNEEFDFAIPAEFLKLPRIISLINALKSPEFVKKINKLDGYDLSNCGEIVLSQHI